MNDKDLKTISTFLSRFGVDEHTVENIDGSYTEPSYQVVTFTVEMFYDQDVAKFATFIRHIKALEAEEALRARNPTLQQAYDEYQLLLKLSK